MTAGHRTPYRCKGRGQSSISFKKAELDHDKRRTAFERRGKPIQPPAKSLTFCRLKGNMRGLRGIQKVTV